jgi:hypothetical protein
MYPQTFNDEEMANAYLLAEKLNLLKSHFIIINPLHLINLFTEGLIAVEGDGFIKKSSGKPCWIYSVSAEASKLLGGK